MSVLLIGLVLWAAGVLAFWALCRQAGRLDDAEGRGDEPDTLRTNLPDLTTVSLADLRDMPDLAPYADKVVEQVERPRANLGGGGPPGRAD